jgi:sulfite exporter TauE/SafE
MIFSAILLGLISSLHCIGMCGPIAMMLPVDHSNPAKKAAQILLYHSGRLTAYSFLGLLFGILGRGFYLAGLQQYISIIAGIIMIIIVMLPEKIVARYNFSKPVYKIIASIKSGLGNQFRKRSSKALFITGLLNGIRCTVWCYIYAKPTIQCILHASLWGWYHPINELSRLCFFCD